MFKISKVLILSLLVVALASPVFATTSRRIALGGVHTINDDSDIFRWYGTLPSYTKMVMVEAGQGSGFGNVSVDYQAVGFTHNWGDDSPLGTWGIFLLKNSIEDGSFYYFNPLVTLGYEGTTMVPTTKWVLSYGDEMESFSYGVNLTRSDASVESSAGGGTNNLSFTTVGAGARFDIGESAYADAALTFAFASGDTLGGFDKSKAIDVSARMFWEWRDDVTFVPYAEWNTFDYNYKNMTPTSGWKGNAFAIGAGMNLDVNTNNMLVLSAEADFATEEPSDPASGDETKTKYTVLPDVTIALETDINSWLTTRLGASKTMVKVVDTAPNGDEVTTTGPVPAFPYDDFSYSLGLGFHVGDWDVDLVLNEDTPFRLGYWLTGFGGGDPDPPVNRISGTYRF